MTQKTLQGRISGQSGLRRVDWPQRPSIGRLHQLSQKECRNHAAALLSKITERPNPDKIMKTANEILDYIDTLYARMLANPQGYALDPPSLEQLFIMLETMREFILGESSMLNRWSPANKYGDFLSIKGHGVAMFAMRLKEVSEASDSHDDDDAHFVALCSFLRLYLQSTRPGFNPDDPELLDRQFTL